MEPSILPLPPMWMVLFPSLLGLLGGAYIWLSGWRPSLSPSVKTLPFPSKQFESFLRSDFYQKKHTEHVRHNRKHRAIMASAETPTHDPQVAVRVCFLGDSITDFFDEEVFRAEYSRLGAVNQGISGDTVEGLFWRIQNGAVEGLDELEVVVVLIGVNNLELYQCSPQHVADATGALLEELQKRLPEQCRILLLGVLPAVPVATSAKSSLQLQICALNEQLKRLCSDIDSDSNLASSLSLTSHKIAFLNLQAHFLEDDADQSLRDELFVDGLHPSVAGYKVWAEAMRPKLKALLAERSREQQAS